jgi:hypothetical protein
VGRRQYVVLEDIIGDEGLVDARVFVRLEVNERILRYALMLQLLLAWCHFCGRSRDRKRQQRGVRLHRE